MDAVCICKKLLGLDTFCCNALSFFFFFFSCSPHMEVQAVLEQTAEILSTIKWLGEDQEDGYCLFQLCSSLWVVGVHYSFWFQAVL